MLFRQTHERSSELTEEEREICRLIKALSQNNELDSKELLDSLDTIKSYIKREECRIKNT